MIIKHKDAKDYWCPMARVMVGASVVNRDNHGIPLITASCIGKKCMMWEWFQGDGDDRGYCGLKQRG